MKIQVIPLILLFLGVGACAGFTDVDHPPVELRTNKASYSTGEEIVLTLTNWHRSRLSVSKSLCHAAIERRGENGWHNAGTLGYPDDGTGINYVCPFESTEVPGEASHSGSTTADLRFEPEGEYRFAVQVSHAGAISVQFSNSFTIAG